MTVFVTQSRNRPPFTKILLQCVSLPTAWSMHYVHLLPVFRISQYFFPAARPFSMMSEFGGPDTIIYYPHSQWTTARPKTTGQPLPAQYTADSYSGVAKPSYSITESIKISQQRLLGGVQTHTDNMQQHLAFNCLKPLNKQDSTMHKGPGVA